MRKIQAELDKFTAELKRQMTTARREFESKLNAEGEKVRLEIELRTRELLRLKEEKRLALEAEEKRIKEELGAVPSLMQEQHRKTLQAMDDMLR